MASPTRKAVMPIVLQQRSTDEFNPPPNSARARLATLHVAEDGPESARRTGHALGNYWATLMSKNLVWIDYGIWTKKKLKIDIANSDGSRILRIYHSSHRLKFKVQR